MKKLFPVLIFSLLAFVGCSDDDGKSLPLNENVVQFIENRYPGAQIRHSEYDDNGLVEVEILHEERIKDVYFVADGEWVYSAWDIRLSEIPDAVKNAVALAYPDFRIDDADFVERADEAYYEIEIEKGGVEMYVFVKPDGEIINNNM